MFRLEDEMLPILSDWAKLCKLVKKGSSVITAQKSQVGRVIPDVIIYSNPPGPSLGLTKRPLSNYESCVLACINAHKKIGIQSLQTELHTQKEVLRSAVENLIKKGLVRTTVEGILSLDRKRTPKHTIISIEAKLTRWREALTQAQSYLKFSNAALIAMPAEVILKTPNLRNECIESGIGLMAVTPNVVRLIEKPKLQHQGSAEWFWIATKLHRTT